MKFTRTTKLTLSHDSYDQYVLCSKRFATFSGRTVHVHLINMLNGSYWLNEMMQLISPSRVHHEEQLIKAWPPPPQRISFILLAYVFESHLLGFHFQFVTFVPSKIMKNLAGVMENKIRNGGLYPVTVDSLRRLRIKTFTFSTAIKYFHNIHHPGSASYEKIY